VLQLLTPDSIKEIELTKHHKRIIKRGDDYLWCSGSAGLKGETGYSHYFTLEELKKLFAEQKVKFLENVGLEGLSSQKKDEVNSLYLKHKKAWKNWLYQHYETCTYPSVVDISSHILLIYKKLNIKR
jgi:hypothetical protein